MIFLVFLFSLSSGSQFLFAFSPIYNYLNEGKSGKLGEKVKGGRRNCSASFAPVYSGLRIPKGEAGGIIKL